jgi:putative flippase GtrA
MFIRFLVVGALGFVVDVALTYALIHLGLGDILARPPAIAGAAIFTWLINRRFTFGASERRPGLEFFRYGVVAALAFGLNFGCYSALILARLEPVWSIAAASVLQAGFSYYAYRHWVFGRPAALDGTSRGGQGLG